MKLRIVSIAALAAIAGQAQALTLGQIATLKAEGNLLEVYMSGASALSATIGGLMTQNCDTTTVDTKFGAAIPLATYTSNFNDAAFDGDTSNGQSVKAYACKLKAQNDFNTTATGTTPFGGKYIVFQKSDQGGSGNGVFPVATGGALPFLNLTAANCTGTVCFSNGFTKVPDMGVSDVSPIGFNPSLNRPLTPINFSSAAAVKNSDFAATPKGVIQTVFGLAVTQPLFEALQAEQGITVGSATRPSVSKAQIGSLLSNSYDVGLAWKPLLPTNAYYNANNTRPENTSEIKICRRVNGSGTQTAANRYFMEYGANEAALSPNDADASEAGAIVIVEGSSTSNVRTCLTDTATAGAFAVGHVSLENAETSNWKFVKIDGMEPSRDNAKKGLYDYVFESTIQVAKTAAPTQKTFGANFATAASKASNLGSLSTAAQAGVLALPTAPDCTADFGTYTAGSNSDKFCSRMTRPNPANLYTIAK